MGRLFVAVLNMSIGASVCILAVMLLRLILKPMPKVFSYLLWAVVLIRLVCPVLPEANFGLMPDMELVEEYTPMSKDMAYRRHLMRMIWQMVLPAESRQADKAYDGSAAGTDSHAGIQEEAADGEEVVTLMPEVVNTEDLPTDYLPTEKIFLWGAAVRLSAGKLRVLAAVWALIGLGLAVYAVVGYILFMRHIDKKKVTTPFVAGLIHPAIYLPDGLGDVPKQLVQEHEKVHISRKDHLIKPFAFLVCCIHWFNPLVWIAFFLMERDMEASCDEAVIRRIGYDRRKDYANTLLGLSQSRGWRAGYPIAFGENHVKSRIKGVVKMKKAGIGVTVLAAVFVVAAAAVLLVNRTGEKEPVTGEDISSGKTEFMDGATDLADDMMLLPEEEHAETTNLPEEQTVDSSSEPEIEGDHGLADIKEHEYYSEEYYPKEYYSNEDLTDDSNWLYTEPSTEENQETIMNYDPNRTRDQYEVLLLPQPEGGFDSIGILFSYPVEGARISDGFGGRIHPASGDVVYHLGIDFAAEEGTPIVAAADGTVAKTDFDADCGNYVIILHENGEATYYFHCKEILAEEGDQVKRGDQIATVGKTGRATGSFVHFAVSRDGKYVEPEFVENEEGN